MVGTINNAYQQQIPVLKTLNPGISEEKQEVNQTSQQEENSEVSANSKVQPTEIRNTGLNNNKNVLQVGKDAGLSSHRADRGQNLDITV